MDRRTLIVMVISFGILLAWSFLFPPTPPVKAPITQATTSAIETIPAAEMHSTPAEIIVVDQPPVNAQTIIVDTPHYRAEINSQGGVLTSFLLKDYQHSKEQIRLGKWVPFLKSFFGDGHAPTVTENNWVQMVSPVKSAQTQTLGLNFTNPELSKVFTETVYTPSIASITLNTAHPQDSLTLVSSVQNGLQVVKTLTFHHDNFVVDYKASLINRQEQAMTLEVQQHFGGGRIQDHISSGSHGHVGAVYFKEGELKTKKNDALEKPYTKGDIEWLGLEDPYFIAAAHSSSPHSKGVFQAFSSGHEEWHPIFWVQLPAMVLQPNQPTEMPFQLYFGPKNDTEMLKFGKHLENSHDMTLAAVAKPLLALLLWIYSYAGNYGVAIIILTILVRLLLLPLAIKSTRSMKRMQQLQPKMKKLQERYKKDKTKLNQEVMDLYRRHKVNPLGGCLPLLFQIPIFFGLYSALSLAVELRHAPFYGWITDLSSPDGLGITPVLMGVSMYFLQKLTPNTMMDPIQAKIMGMLPLIFTFFTFTFPAGLTLYWTTSNLISIVQQSFILKMKMPEIQEG